MEVSDDALKLLVAEHGVRGTARLLGMDETQTHTFRQRVTRGKWLADPAMIALRSKSEPPVAGRPVLPVTVMSPLAANAAELARLGMQTRMGIAKGLARAGDKIGDMGGGEILDAAHEIKSVAQTASLVHSWDRQGATPKIRIDLLANKGEVASIEVESEVVSGDWADDY